MPQLPVPVEQRLLLAAKKLFASQGFENTTTAAIARAAGTSESQLVKYFGNKEGLLVKIFEAGWKQMDFVYTAASVSETPLEALRVVFELLIKLLTEDRALRDLMLFEGRRIRGKGNTVLVTSGYFRLYSEVTRLLRELLRDSPLQQRLRPEAIASGFIGMLESMLRDQAMNERKTGETDPKPEEIRAMFQLFSVSLRDAAQADANVQGAIKQNSNSIV